jgi:hypothetical protein
VKELVYQLVSCPCILSPKDKSTLFSSAKEELKVLNFKSQKGALSTEEAQHLAQLHREGSSTRGVSLGEEPWVDHQVGGPIPVKQ